MPYKDPQKEQEFQEEYRRSGRGAEATRRWRSDPTNRQKERRRLNDYNRYRKDRAVFLMRRRLKAHGVTQEQFDAKVLGQKNACAICGKQMVSPNIDHNHTTGQIRDLLCQQCNTILGMCFESTEILQNTIEYLKRHTVES